MSVSGDYSQPVPVNGYLCWNCSQVADAKKGVNPADVKPGETAAQAAASPSNTTSTSAVTFGGALAGTSSASGSQSPSSSGVGTLLNISA
jgi:hypothetical protein